MREFVRQPERNQLRVQTKPLRVGIRHPGKMLKTDKCHAASVDHQLAGIGRSHPNHQHDIVGHVDIEQGANLLFRLSR